MIEEALGHYFRTVIMEDPVGSTDWAGAVIWRRVQMTRSPAWKLNEM